MTHNRHPIYSKNLRGAVRDTSQPRAHPHDPPKSSVSFQITLKAHTQDALYIKYPTAKNLRKAVYLAIVDALKEAAK